MTPRLPRVWLLAIIAGASITSVAQTPTGFPPSPASHKQPTTPPAANSSPEEMVPIQLREAPLELIIPMLEMWTGRTVLRPQTLPTPLLTISAKDPMPKSEAICAIETLLNLNQIGLVRMGDKFLKIVPLQSIRLESPEVVEGSTLNLPPSGQIVTKLIQLQFLRVGEFLPQISILLNQNVSQPVIFEKNNAALITDSISTLQRIEMLVEKLDLPVMSNLAPKFYNIHFAKASDVVNKLRTMFQGQLQNQLGAATSYSADDRTNQLILIADPRQYAFFDELVAKLDVKSDPNTRTEVLYLKHAASKDVASLLSQLVSGQTKAAQSSGSVQPGQGNQPNQSPAPPDAIAPVLGELGSSQFSSLITILPDDRSNAVVVNGTIDDLRLIKDLVDKIDIVLAQVRIEVVIAEVSLGDEASSGIKSLGLDVSGNKLLGFKGNASGVDVGGSTTSPLYYQNSGVLSPGHAASIGNSSLIGLVSLNTTPRKNNSTIVSTPAITTTHNKEAKLVFGETRPVISGSTTTPTTSTGPSTSSQITQLDIGTTLTVKPLIGNDGSVQLDIKQTITDVQSTVKVDGNDQYVMGKRETNSFVTVKSGEIIVLGGMQKTNNTHSTSRLGPIPWIGDLLGFRSRTKNRSELVVFIRPTVLTNTAADNVEALKRIDTMPDGGEIRQKLDPNYVPPKEPFYKKHIKIP